MKRFAALRGSVCRAALCAVASIGLSCPALKEAGAVTPAVWRETLYSYRADEELSLAQVLDRFSSTLGLEVKLADSALGRRRVHLGGKGVSPAVFLDRLGDAQGLDWFVYQGVLHISARSSAVSERIALGPQSPSDAKDALVGIGLFESRFGWGEFDSDPPTVLVSGPPAYVALVRRVLQIPADAGPRREEPRLMVFRLKHASAADREMRTRDRTVVLPGLVATLNQVLPHARAAQGASTRRRAMAAPTGAEEPWAQRSKEADGLASPLDAALAALPAAHLPLAAATGTGTGSAATAGAPLAIAGPLAPPVAASGRSSRGRPADDEVDFTPAITAYTPLNAVLVWDLPSRRETYRALIDELDMPNRLVEINVTILDVSADALRDWSVDIDARVGGGAGRTGLQIGADGVGASDGAKGSTMTLWASDRLALRLRALESRGQAQVLSRPSVLTMNNVGALLDMNQSAYVKLVGERTTDLRSVTAGTLLKVTPSIVGDSSAPADTQGIRVTLDIEDGQLSPPSSDAGTPSVDNSAVSTEALVRPGESLVIGGYRRQQRQVKNSRVPVLGAVPVIGALFRSDSSASVERERLFILTARAL